MIAIVVLLGLLTGETWAHESTNYYNGNPYQEYGHQQGCRASNLSFFCEFGTGVFGDLLFNKCRYYDPAPYYNCTGDLGLPTRGFKCNFCCKLPNGRVPECSLNFKIPPVHQGDDSNQPLPPTSPIHCVGRAKGNLCNQAAGSCDDYCCATETRNPCISPLCPLQTSSSETQRLANGRTIKAQCKWWLESRGPSRHQTTLTQAAWGRINQQNTATGNQGGNTADNQGGNLRECHRNYITRGDRCCLRLYNGGEFCYSRQSRNQY